MKIQLSKVLIRFIAFIERVADIIYLSTDDTDEATRKAYTEGRAKFAEEMDKELSALKKKPKKNS